MTEKCKQNSERGVWDEFEQQILAGKRAACDSLGSRGVVHTDCRDNISSSYFHRRELELGLILKAVVHLPV